MIHHYRIEGERLILEPLSQENIEYLRLLRNRSENRSAFFDSALIDQESQKRWYQKYQSKKGDYMFQVRERISGDVIGAVALYDIDSQNSVAEFGRLVIDAEKAGGYGYGTEASALACRIGFEQMRLERIDLSVWTDNIKALTIYRKLGFRLLKQSVREGKSVEEMSLYRPKKILYTASRLSHIRNFHLPYIMYLKSSGHQVDVLGEGEETIPEADQIWHLPMAKKITSLSNLKRILDIRNILQKEKYDLVISNSTLAGFITRMAKKITTVKPALIHIAHGYLFGKETAFPKKQIYILAEKLCKKETDLLLTMNSEDFELAKQYCLAENIHSIRGMGIRETEPIKEITREETRRMYGLSAEEFVVIYAAELSERKNHAYLIKCLSEILLRYPKVKLVFAGEGKTRETLCRLIEENNLTGQIVMPGYVKEIKPLISACDLAISSAKSEGLPFNIMEAMSLGVPVIASAVKGHVDLIRDGDNGYLFSLDDPETLKNKFVKIITDARRREEFAERSIEMIRSYTLEAVFAENMAQIERCLNSSNR